MVNNFFKLFCDTFDIPGNGLKKKSHIKIAKIARFGIYLRSIKLVLYY